MNKCGFIVASAKCINHHFERLKRNLYILRFIWNVNFNVTLEYFQCIQSTTKTKTNEKLTGKLTFCATNMKYHKWNKTNIYMYWEPHFTHDYDRNVNNSKCYIMLMIHWISIENAVEWCRFIERLQSKIVDDMISFSFSLSTSVRVCVCVCVGMM